MFTMLQNIRQIFMGWDIVGQVQHSYKHSIIEIDVSATMLEYICARMRNEAMGFWNVRQCSIHTKHEQIVGIWLCLSTLLILLVLYKTLHHGYIIRQCILWLPLPPSLPQRSYFTKMLLLRSWMQITNDSLTTHNTEIIKTRSKR